MFGLATTIFLIAIWGRAVVIDVDALQEASTPLADSSAVIELFTSWLDTELSDSGVDPATSQLVVEEVLQQSSVGWALQRFAAELVVAAAAPGPEGASIDVAGLLEPAVPEIDAALSSAGVSVSRPRLAELVSELDPLIVRAPGTEPLVGSESQTASRLGTAAILSIFAMAMTGWAAVAASDDRLGEARSLLSRVALGALSFAIILKVGSWVLDPQGGRAPLAESAATVANSQWLLPLGLALVAGVAAVTVWAARRVIRRRAESPQPYEQAIPPRERQLTRSE